MAPHLALVSLIKLAIWCTPKVRHLVRLLWSQLTLGVLGQVKSRFPQDAMTISLAFGSSVCRLMNNLLQERLPLKYALLGCQVWCHGACCYGFPPGCLVAQPLVEHGRLHYDSFFHLGMGEKSS